MKVKVELEQEQWGWVLDAISESESKAQQYEEMWEGGCREKQYRDEKETFAKLYDDINKQLGGFEEIKKC